MGQVVVKLPDELEKKIDEIAKQEYNPKSAVIRRLISIGIDTLENLETFKK